MLQIKTTNNKKNGWLKEIFDSHQNLLCQNVLDQFYIFAFIAICTGIP